SVVPLKYLSRILENISESLHSIGRLCSCVLISHVEKSKISGLARPFHCFNTSKASQSFQDLFFQTRSLSWSELKLMTDTLCAASPTVRMLLSEQAPFRADSRVWAESLRDIISLPTSVLIQTFPSTSILDFSLNIGSPQLQASDLLHQCIHIGIHWPAGKGWEAGKVPDEPGDWEGWTSSFLDLEGFRLNQALAINGIHKF
ncbi:hypothetical protein LINGRAHAP2_LOCUS34372, partial [Linum grandiflorum]